jgi:hypothetical protein
MKNQTNILSIRGVYGRKQFGLVMYPWFSMVLHVYPCATHALCIHICSSA